MTNLQRTHCISWRKNCSDSCFKTKDWCKTKVVYTIILLYSIKVSVHMIQIANCFIERILSSNRDSLAHSGHQTPTSGTATGLLIKSNMQKCSVLQKSIVASTMQNQTLDINLTNRNKTSIKYVKKNRLKCYQLLWWILKWKHQSPQTSWWLRSSEKTFSSWPGICVGRKLTR